MACKIIWSAQALEDFRNLTHFIAMDNPRAAAQTGSAIFEKVDLLKEHPLLGRIVPERRRANLREIIHPPYRIVYRFQKHASSVEVLRIWHGARGTPQI